MRFNILGVLIVSSCRVQAFAPSLYPNRNNGIITSSTKSLSGSPLVVLRSSKEDEKGIMDIIAMKVDIPDEVRDDIFKAEANTPAAKDRGTRIVLYATLAFIGIVLSSSNAFLTTVRADAGGGASDLSSIEAIGFGWVGSNPLASFFLLNKIGGGIALISAGFGGTMVELEQRTKNESAEKIWKELQRRRTEGAPKKKKKKVIAPSNKKKKQKNKKRLSALSEVIMEDKPTIDTAPVVEEPDETSQAKASIENEKKEEGFLGKMKGFYDQADKMAASQALLLNKELEDKGLVDKITDESGLKVIGKEAATKLKDQNDEL